MTLHPDTAGTFIDGMMAYGELLSLYPHCHRDSSISSLRAVTGDGSTVCCILC